MLQLTGFQRVGLGVRSFSRASRTSALHRLQAWHVSLFGLLGSDRNHREHERAAPPQKRAKKERERDFKAECCCQCSKLHGFSGGFSKLHRSLNLALSPFSHQLLQLVGPSQFEHNQTHQNQIRPIQILDLNLPTKHSGSVGDCPGVPCNRPQHQRKRQAIAQQACKQAKSSAQRKQQYNKILKQNAKTTTKCLVHLEDPGDLAQRPPNLPPKTLLPRLGRFFAGGLGLGTFAWRTHGADRSTLKRLKRCAAWSWQKSRGRKGYHLTIGVDGAKAVIVHVLVRILGSFMAAPFFLRRLEVGSG